MSGCKRWQKMGECSFTLQAFILRCCSRVASHVEDVVKMRTQEFSLLFAKQGVGEKYKCIVCDFLLTNRDKVLAEDHFRRYHFDRYAALMKELGASEAFVFQPFLCRPTRLLFI